MQSKFFDLPDFASLENKKKIWVLPVPFEGTVSYGTGTKKGPEAIIEASTQIESFDPELAISLEEYCYFKLLPEINRNVHGVEFFLKDIETFLRNNFVPQNDFICTLGGEHSITFPLVKFYKQAYKDLVVLQIDAHADLRNEYEGSKYSHACVMNRCLELGCEIIQIGIRSVCKEEWNLIKNSPRITTFFPWENLSPSQVAEKCKAIISKRPLYLTFDADGLDPSIMPGVGTPEPGGISYEWFKTFISELWPLNLVGMDFCELAPQPFSVLSQSVAAKCIFKILTSFFYKQKRK